MKKNKKAEQVINDKDQKYTEKEIKEATKKARKDIFMDYVPYIIIIIFVLLIRTYVATPVKVNGSSMRPTLQNGDTMILYKLRKKVKGLDRFDIVVVQTDSGKLIKRIIGIPGENIRYERGETDQGVYTAYLYVDGKLVDEDYISYDAKYNTCENDPQVCSEEGVTLGDDEYFVLGDNRGNSKDSRMIGAVKYEDIIGTTKLIIFPFNRIGTVD